MRTSRAGVGYGLAAYLIWGLFPLYWPLLAPTPAIQILAHRMVWSLVVVGVVLVVRRRWAFVSALRSDPHRVGLRTPAMATVTSTVSRPDRLRRSLARRQRRRRVAPEILLRRE